MSSCACVRRVYNQDMKRVIKKKKEKATTAKRGSFIVIEGDDGSGKSSCIDFLTKKLSGRGDVIFTREPGGTSAGELIRKVLQDPNIPEVDVKTDLLLYSAARAEHLAKVITPALEQGKCIICDRFDLSTWAYQIHTRDNDSSAEYFGKLNSFVVGNSAPDIYIFLDVSPEVGAGRSRKRNDELSRFDKKNLEFHAQVREGYKKYIKKVPHKIIDTDNLSAEEVSMLVYRMVLELIKN